MRSIIVGVALVWVACTPAFGANGSAYNAFIKSREVVATFYFKPNSDTLTQSENRRLRESISELRQLQNSGRMIRVEGFSSPVGNQEKNFHLSLFRARAVADLVEAEGLPAEVALTGYGDLLASSADSDKERRVEIASYLKPVGVKKIKVVEKVKKIVPKPLPICPEPQQDDGEINSLKIDQAIRGKFYKTSKVPAKKQPLECIVSPDSLRTPEDIKRETERGYEQWRKSVDPGYKPKQSYQEKDVNDGLKSRFKKLRKINESGVAPGVTRSVPQKMPVIDALMIEQAIMDKIGAEPSAPAGTVSHADLPY